MLRWSLTFFVVALIAALLGFSGLAGAAGGMSKILFLLFLILFVISLFMGRTRTPLVEGRGSSRLSSRARRSP